MIPTRGIIIITTIIVIIMIANIYGEIEMEVLVDPEEVGDPRPIMEVGGATLVEVVVIQGGNAAGVEIETIRLFLPPIKPTTLKKKKARSKNVRV